MPVTLHSSENLTTKSALRHRPIHPDAAPGVVPRVPRASRTRAKTHKPAASATTAGDIPAWKHTDATSRSAPRPGRLGFVGIGMLVAVALFLLGQSLVNWIGTTWDDLHYGRPRTFQTDAFVGHEAGNVPSHFIALNLAGRIEVIELPGGDARHAKIYLGPHLYGPNADLVPVTLQFVDHRHDHRPDMLVLFQGTQLVFHNTQGTFQPPKGAES